jgi:hypothetical protein
MLTMSLPDRGLSNRDDSTDNSLLAWAARASAWTLDLAEKVSARLPDRALILAGRLLYRHVG